MMDEYSYSMLTHIAAFKHESRRKAAHNARLAKAAAESAAAKAAFEALQSGLDEAMRQEAAALARWKAADEAAAASFILVVSSFQSLLQYPNFQASKKGE